MAITPQQYSQLVAQNTAAGISTPTIDVVNGVGLPAGYVNPYTISSASMAPVATVPVAPVVPDATNYAAQSAAITATLQKQATDAQTQYDAQNAAALKQNTDISNMQSLLGGQAQDTLNLYNSSGVTDLAKQLKDLATQAQNESLNAQQANLTLDQNSGGKDVTTAYLGRQQQEVNRVSTIKLLGLSQQSNILQGNYDAAKGNADAIINARYSQLTADVNAKITQLNGLKDYVLTPAQTKAKDAQAALLEKQKQDLADAKQAEQNNVTNQLGWAKTAYDSGDSKLASQISALDPSSSTFKTDLASLQAKINPDNSLDSQYKKMQIAELAQKISDAKNTSDGLAGLNGLVTPVAQLADGTYDTATQDALLSQMSPGDAAIVKAVGTYTMDIAKVTSLRSDAREILAKKVALVYPGFDMTNYATHAAYRKSLAGTTQGTTGGAINSANKVINHLTAFVDNTSKLGNGVLSGVNWIDNTFGGKFNQDFQTALMESKTDATGVKDELAKFFKGSGVADVTSISDWGKTVNVNGSPAQIKGSVQGAIELLQGQLVPMIDQYKQIMGQEPPDGLFLKTDTIAKLSTLKNQGFKIDIPGVNYTDKNAWLKYGGGSQDQWNSAVDNLTKNNLPVTQENILQTAQMSFNSEGSASNNAQVKGWSNTISPMPYESVGKGIIGGYDINSYATDPNHEVKVQNLYNQIGTINSTQQADSYIGKIAKNSPVLGQDVIDASKQTGVPASLILAIMQQDSSFGTAGKAIRTKNPGNVGNTDSGATKNFGSWRDGVFAVANNLARRKVG